MTLIIHRPLLAGCITYKAIEAIDPEPLYARVDMVRSEWHDFVVMELELIEPSLYLRMDNNAPDRFAKALDQRIRSLSQL